MKSVTLHYEQNLGMTVEVKVDSISVQSFRMWMSNYAPYRILDEDYIWEISLQDAIDKPTEALYSDFVMTTEQTISFSDFAKMMQRARISRTVLVN